MHRYDPFSGAACLRDASIYCRAGSTVLAFLEPGGDYMAKSGGTSGRPGGGQNQGKSRPDGTPNTKPGGGSSGTRGGNGAGSGPAGPPKTR